MTVLTLIRRVVGHDGTTTETELTRAGKSLLGGMFGGVVASNEPLPRGKYAIANTTPRGTPGEHWFAVAPDHTVYDSLQKNGVAMDIEQQSFEKNCGQRALAWCCLHLHDAELAASL